MVPPLRLRVAWPFAETFLDAMQLPPLPGAESLRRTATRLGINRNTLQFRMKRLGIERPKLGE